MSGYICSSNNINNNKCVIERSRSLKGIIFPEKMSQSEDVRHNVVLRKIKASASVFSFFLDVVFEIGTQHTQTHTLLSVCSEFFTVYFFTLSNYVKPSQCGCFPWLMTPCQKMYATLSEPDKHTP